MNIQAQYLLDEALKLPAESREDLAVRLMGSVEPTETEAAKIKQAWTEEIDRRVAKFESGESKALSVEEVWPQITGKPWRSQSADE